MIGKYKINFLLYEYASLHIIINCIKFLFFVFLGITAKMFEIYIIN